MTRCPRDTNGDGNCGQRLCPACGEYWRKYPPMLDSCGRYIPDGHMVYDPACMACAETNSDAPDWTL